MVLFENQLPQREVDEIGYEFVRQYYTLLHKAPNQLHYIYNKDSSFTHDQPTPIQGQENIHNAIKGLHFKNCGVKIDKLSCQATLDNGVVVMVAGERSNGGQPKRRFTQTFVLASKTPKDYSIQNDIFRYVQCASDDEDEEFHPNNKGEGGDEEPNNQQIKSIAKKERKCSIFKKPELPKQGDENAATTSSQAARYQDALAVDDEGEIPELESVEYSTDDTSMQSTYYSMPADNAGDAPAEDASQEDDYYSMSEDIDGPMPDLEPAESDDDTMQTDDYYAAEEAPAVVGSDID